MSSPEDAMALTPAERNRIEIEDAVSLLTHHCRKHPTLRLRPEACELRKSKRQKIKGKHSYPIFEQCQDCPGPIQIHQGKEKKVLEQRCRKCGRGASEVRFYPSRPSTCVPCIRERNHDRKAAQPQTWSPIVEEPVKSEATEEVPVEEVLVEPEIVDPKDAEELPEETPYHCEIHGPHGGRKFGLSHSVICPKCHSEQMSKKMKLVNRKGPGMEHAPADPIVLPQWIGDWAAEQASKKGISARELVFGLVGEQIPSEWLKKWLLKNWSQNENGAS